MTTKEMAVVAIFEDKLEKKSILASYKYFTDEDFKPVSPKEAKDILSKCKKAFYRRVNMKGVEIFSKFTNEYNYTTYAAIVPPSFFLDDEPVMAHVEFDIDDDKMLRINFISIFTGEIKQGTYKYDRD